MKHLISSKIDLMKLYVFFGSDFRCYIMLTNPRRTLIRVVRARSPFDVRNLSSLLDAFRRYLSAVVLTESSGLASVDELLISFNKANPSTPDVKKEVGEQLVKNFDQDGDGKLSYRGKYCSFQFPFRNLNHCGG